MSTKSNEIDDNDVKIFVGDQRGPESYVGFFEDDGETGYLYVSDRSTKQIIQQLQIYVNSAQLRVEPEDVRVVWSKNGTKCGVLIWGGMRGIIDLERNREGRAFVDSRTTPPIDDAEWLGGFDVF
jgi:hypothetical protein